MLSLTELLSMLRDLRDKVDETIAELEGIEDIMSEQLRATYDGPPAEVDDNDG